jgi:hypothetical protein
MSLDTATAVLKIPNPSMATTIPGRRPLSSDSGAQMSGPDAYPTMYSELDRTETSRPTPKCFETFWDEELKMAESKVEQILVKASMAPIYTLGEMLDHIFHRTE